MDTPLDHSFNQEPHENQQEHHEQTQHQKHHDERSGVDYFLQETNKMIKEGRTKKAFNQLDKFLQENLTMSVISKLKIIRRLIACASKIITKYLAKNDVSHADIFGKLIDKSFTYLQQWHDLLSLYIVKTNQKFKHLDQLLDNNHGDDLDELSDMMNNSRRDNRKEKSMTQSESQSGQKSSIFVNMVRQQSNNATHKDKDHELLENTFNFLDGSRVISEEFTGKEINVSFFLDEFYEYLILTTLNWGLFMKKMQKYPAAYKYFYVTYKFTQEVESSLNPDLLYVIVRARFPLAVFYLEFGRIKEAQEIYEGLINIIQVAMSIRMNRQKEKKGNENEMMARLKKIVRYLIIIFLTIAMISEQQENYQKVTESLKLAYWFTTKFLAPDEELWKIVEKRYKHPLAEEYRKYLHELGEIDRLISGNKKELLEFGNNKIADSNDHFTKLNEYLYNKFNYETLNKSQFIMIKNNRTQSASNFFKNTRTDFTLDRTDRFFIDGDYEKNSDGSYQKQNTSPFKGENFESSYKNSPDGDIYNRKSQVRPVTSITKKKSKKDRRRNEQQPDLIESKYSKKPEPEEAIDHYDLSEDEEREYINMLNRNIRDEAKRKKATEYPDIDSYFTKTIKEQIFNNSKLSRAYSQPIEFERVLKGYGYFLKEEEYDKNELGFAKKYVVAKKKESLIGDLSVKAKFVPREPKMAEFNNFKIEVSNIKSKIQSENILKIRNENYKNFAKTWKKEIGYRESKQPDDPRSSKLGFIKTSGALGLKEGASITTFDDRDLKNIKTALSPIHHLDKPGTTEPSEREIFNKSKSIFDLSETANNRLQLMREQIEKTIQDDEVVKRKLKNNQPLFVEKKKKERFLKVSNELGQSCLEYASKKDPEQKMLNITDLLKTKAENTKKDRFGKVRKNLNQIKDLGKKGGIPEES